MKKYTLVALVLAAALIIPSPTAVVRAQTVPDLTSDLVLYYSFDDASNLAKDSSGNGNNGTLIGTVLPIPTLGINEGAAYFNRAGYSGIATPESAQLGASYTKSVWAYISKPSGGGASFISQPSKTSKQHVFMAYGSNSIITSNSYNYANPKITQLITLNSWVNAVTTYDAPTRTLKLYIDGALAQTLADVDPIPSNERGIEIGSFATSGATKTFDGPLDELRVYSRALTDSEVAALHVLDQQSHGVNQAPQATNVTATGATSVGASLTGSYTFFDVDGDAEGISAYRWMRSSSENGTYTNIPGATYRTYEITEADTGMFLKFQVTPNALTGQTPGAAVRSAAVEIPVVVTTPPVEDPTPPDTGTPPTGSSDGISSGLLLHYSFDNANDIGHDDSGNGNDGVLAGSVLPTSATGIHGNAAFLNRAGSSRIVVPSQAELGESYTKSVWAYMAKSNGGGAGFISHPTATKKQPVFMGYGSNSIITANVYSISDPKITRLITLGNWVHAVTTYDAPTRTLKLYLDGVLTDTLTDIDPI
ncbi:MAG: laminin G domain-containing protein, partial [Alphaproteobacteria bacterium]|nr:laminin G domain-containing protein [Alphaproteobacteria bacterium]